jgi:HPt (histidine-containing phosphotransfer) domain-containing protein
MNADDYRVIVAKDIADLIPVFMKNRHKELEALRVALAAADFEQLRQLGHRMKGVGNSKSGDRNALAATITEYDNYLSKVQIAYE